MKNVAKFLIPLSVFLILIMPVFSFAQTKVPVSTNGGLVPCNNTPDDTGKIAQPCDFNAFITLLHNVITFILFDLVIPICAIMFAYAGFLLVTAGGEAAGARTRAKGIFTHALIGLVVAFAAWLIIKLILTILGYKGGPISF